jgi:hypothetical protein
VQIPLGGYIAIFGQRKVKVLLNILPKGISIHAGTGACFLIDFHPALS